MTERRKGSPIDAGPRVRLPAGQLALGTLVGVAIVTGLAALIANSIRPAGGGVSALAGGGGAVVAHALGLVGDRPWRTLALGRWSFTILHVSLGTTLVLLAWIGLLYSAPQIDATSLSLSAAGAWFGGLLAKVALFGVFAGKVESDPSRFGFDAGASGSSDAENTRLDEPCHHDEDTRHDVSADTSRSQ